MCDNNCENCSCEDTQAKTPKQIQEESQYLIHGFQIINTIKVLEDVATKKQYDIALSVVNQIFSNAEEFNEEDYKLTYAQEG